jgi:Zn-dependent M16 (insulinase) family peptidase
MKASRFFLNFFLLIFIYFSVSCQSDKYKEGSTYFGFKLIEKRFVEEINTDCYLFEHVKSGARLLKFATNDANKTFSIAFKTTPESDSGTPHIMEHSVLNGSKNFPVKSPFDVLAKGSLNTFLNAMTGGDITIYPVASMNDKDYFNLMHVYLDAVFNPLIYDDTRILKQEGWHHELTSENEAVVYKGVVYNEMKGAFSSPTRELGYLIDKNLFPDNSYGFSSGGYPAAIPQLTYEQFLNFHRKYYHPSNSYIFLYGNADLDDELAFINDNYLTDYDKSEDIASIEIQKPFKELKKVTGYYSVPDGSRTEDKTYLNLSWVIGEGKDQALGMALDVLSDVLVNHESGPIRLALQEAGIGKDVSSYYDGQNQNSLHIRVQNADPLDIDKFYNIVMNTLQETVEKGIDKEKINGIINRIEFRLREGDDAQKGLTYIFQAYSGWFYADNPFLSLEWEKPLAEIKKALTSDLLEKIIEEEILDNPHTLLLSMEPKPGLENERNKIIAAECAEYKEKLSATEIKTLIKETEELVEYQKREDTQEALATIPLLSIADINPQAEWYPISENKVGDNVELYYDTFTNSIVYTSLLFDARVLPQEMIPYASILTELLGSLNTENYSYGDLDNVLNIHTGGFNASLKTYLEGRDDNKMIPKIVVSTKTLNTKVDKLFELTDEILNQTIYSDKDRLKTVLSRHQSRLEDRVKRDGLGYARTRLTSYYSNQGMFNELTTGLEYYWFVTDLVNGFDNNADEIIANLEEAAKLLFNKKNLKVAVTCEKKDLEYFNNELETFLNKLSDDRVEARQWTFKFENKNEGFLAASKVQYVLKGYNFKKLGYDWNGKMRVMNQVLSREWLTNQIRVIGGAYGGFCNFSSSGQVYFGSYRDPNLKETIDNFDASPEFLSEFEPDEDAMTRFIIGTIARMDRPLSPSDEGNLAVNRYLEKVTQEDIQKERDDVLATVPEDIRKMNTLVADILKQNALSVYGNEDKVKSNKGLFKKILTLDK